MKNLRDPIVVEHLFKRYNKTVSFFDRDKEREGVSRTKSFWALKDISFSVKRGEAFGVIGKNGSGKTTLLKILAGISAPTKGTVYLKGRVAPLIGLGVGFHQEMTGRENIFINGILLGMTPGFIKERLSAVQQFSEVGDFLETPLKYYSSGMQVRLGFAIVAQAEPDILLIDEVLSVGDVAFQRKCLDRVRELKEQGTSIVFVSHNIFSVEGLCERALLLSKGKPIASGKTLQVTNAYTNLINQEEIKRQSKRKKVIQKSTGVSIGKITFRQDGKRKQQIKMLKDFEVGLEITFASPTESPGISFSLVRGDGQLCGSNRWLMSSMVIQGKIHYQFNIKKLALVPDVYRIHILIWDKTFLGAYTHVVSQPFLVRASAANFNRDWGVYVPEVNYEPVTASS